MTTPEEWRDLYDNLLYPHPDWFIKPEDFSRELTKDDLEFLAAYKRGLEERIVNRGPAPSLMLVFGVDDDGVVSAASKAWEMWIYIRTGHHPAEWVYRLKIA